jgi:photosystem II stability/assembly factor-like uncharacterized protein
MKYILLILILCGHFLITTAQQGYAVCDQFHADQRPWTFLGPINDSANLANQHFGALKCFSINPSDSNEIYVGSYTGGLFYTSDRGANWTCLSDSYPIALCGIGDLIVDYSKTPHSLTIATGSSEGWYDVANQGILQSFDHGKSWMPRFPEGHELFTFDEVKRFVLSPDSAVWYAFGKKEILQSVDQGQHWKLIFSPNLFPNFYQNNDYQIQSLQVTEDAQHLFFTSFSGEIRNAQTGEIERESDLLEWHIGKDLQPQRRTQLFRQAHKTLDSRNTNTLKIVQIPNRPRQFILHRTINESNEQFLYFIDMAELKVDSLVEIQGGSYESIYWMNGLCVNAINPSVLYYGGTTLYKSSDAGHTFSNLYSYSNGSNNIPHPDIRRMYITYSSADGENDHLYLMTDGGLSFSSDGGKHFRNLNGRSLPITQFYGLSSSPFTGIISAGSQDNSIMSYMPQQNKWIVDIKGDGYDIEYSGIQKGLVYGQYNSFLLSASYNDIAPFMKNTGIEAKPHSMNKRTLHMHENGTLYVASHDLDILFPGRNKWVRNQTGFDHAILTLGLCSSHPEIVYASQSWSKLFKSTDSGKHFTDISLQLKLGDRFFGDTRIHAICVDPQDPDRLWISLGYLGDYLNPCKATTRVLFSMDGGTNWVDYSEGLPVYYLSDIRYIDGSDDVLIASSQQGVYIREGVQQSWKLLGSELPKCIITELNINYCRGKIIVSTYGRGLWEHDLPDIRRKPTYINRPVIISPGPGQKEFYSKGDISLGKKGKLEIHMPVHMPKGGQITVHHEDQIQFIGEGKIINACDEKWNGIIVKGKKRKKK